MLIILLYRIIIAVCTDYILVSPLVYYLFSLVDQFVKLAEIVKFKILVILLTNKFEYKLGFLSCSSF